jgi:hypothetical protein
VRRAVVVAALGGIALIHVLDLQGKLHELPYVGVLFIGLIVSCLIVGEILIRTDNPWLGRPPDCSPRQRSWGMSSAVPPGCPAITMTTWATGSNR